MLEQSKLSDLLLEQTRLDIKKMELEKRQRDAIDKLEAKKIYQGLESRGLDRFSTIKPKTELQKSASAILKAELVNKDGNMSVIVPHDYSKQPWTGLDVFNSSKKRTQEFMDEIPNGYLPQRETMINLNNLGFDPFDTVPSHLKDTNTLKENARRRVAPLFNTVENVQQNQAPYYIANLPTFPFQTLLSKAMDIDKYNRKIKERLKKAKKKSKVKLGESEPSDEEEE